MNSSVYVMEIDGRRVVIDQAGSQVAIFNEAGNLLFRERIQVAAGSPLGLFSALDPASIIGLGTEHTRNA